jgi:phosphoribosylanthranilate isomerase
MKIKICGLKYWDNLLEITQEKPDYIGLIFYAKSPRFVSFDNTSIDWKQIPSEIKKIGVFVNESLENVHQIHKNYQLDYVQLHGDESPEYCKNISIHGIKIIKAFGVDSNFDFKKLNSYTQNCEYFLFDTAHANYGGTGQRFDWSILNNYDLEIPFFLSGGIGMDSILSALNFKHSQLIGIDLNSKLELEPGIKNKTTVKKILQQIKQHEYIQP